MPSPASRRAQLRERRRAIAPDARMRAAEAVASRLLALPDIPDRGYVAGYWAMDGELPLHAWQIQLPPGRVYCLPVLDPGERRLRFAPWRPGDALVTNCYGIPEPDLSADALLDAGDMSLIAMPLTGFDRYGHRLGMGGGWYDRTLAFRAGRPAPPLCVGIGFDVQELPPFEPQPWDVACDAIVTESRTLFRDPP